ncbi:hypothetical protein FRB97_000002 [Tulasnella sp. 331]|nr:hypothetical protein FRB97_000002 [Tulasnella sp. 331]KAG8890725.1 hypothetical protein FRB98_006229 [Tulasnella sp. 332]
MSTQENAKQLLEDHLKRSVPSKVYGEAASDSSWEDNLIVTKALDLSIKELRQKDDQQSIKSLPATILLDIFFIVLKADEDYAYYETLYTLSQVSAGWALIIRQSPSFWRLINFNHSAQIHDIALSRSKESPIDIIDSMSGELGSNDSLITRLIPQSHRWRSMKYCGSTDHCWVDRLSSIHAPALEHLDINVSMRPRILELFRGEAPSLKYLHLWGCSIDWRSNMLSGLRTLQLNAIAPVPPSVEELVNVLRASPTLIKLILSRFECAASSSDSPLARPVELVHLMMFKLYDLPHHATHSLLRVLRIPKCTQFALNVRSETPPDLFDASTSHIIAVVNNILASEPEISLSSLQITEDTISLQRWRTTTYRMELEVTLHGSLRMAQMASFVGVFNSPRAVNFDNLIINSMSQGIPLSSILPIFRSACRSQHLHMIGWESTDEAFKCLGQPITIDGTTRWPLPALKTISLGPFQPKTQVLLDMVRRRYEADSGLDGMDGGARSVERPVALEKLAISAPFKNTDAAEVSRLKSMLGEGVLEWDASAE